MTIIFQTFFRKTSKIIVKIAFFFIYRPYNGPDTKYERAFENYLCFGSFFVVTLIGYQLYYTEKFE